MSKVLELSIDGVSACGDVYSDHEVVLHNPFEGSPVELPFEDGEFIGVFAHFILQRVSWRDTALAMIEWARVVQDEGLVHVIVPSGNWLARNMLQDRVEPHVRMLLFGDHGSQYGIHMNALNATDLRVFFDHAGLGVVKARIGGCEVMVGEKSYEAEQIYVAGVKL